jgi:hypothetical protein
MSRDDKTVAAIVFGIAFVITLKTVQVALQYCFPNFASSNPYLVSGIAGAVGAIVAFWLVRKLFPHSVSGMR